MSAQRLQPLTQHRLLNTYLEVVSESKLWISSSVGVPPVPDGRHGSLQALQRPASGFEPRQRDPEIRTCFYLANAKLRVQGNIRKQ